MARPSKREIVAGFLNAVLGGAGILMGGFMVFAMVRILLSVPSALGQSSTTILFSRDLLSDLGSLAVSALMLTSGIGLLNSKPWARKTTHAYCITLVAWSVVTNLLALLERWLIDHYAGGTWTIPGADYAMLMAGPFSWVSIAACTGYAIFLVLMLGKKPRATSPYEDADNGAVGAAN